MTTLLGCSADSISIVFDLLFEAYGQQEFQIVLNKDFDVTPNLPVKTYAYHLLALEEFSQVKESVFAFGVATPKLKARVFKDFLDSYSLEKAAYTSIVHPSAYVAPSAVLSQGVVIEPHAVISSQSTIGFGVNIKRGVNIGHHNTIGDFCDINPGSTLSGKVTIGKGTIVGSGTVVKDNITIGENCIIGMGSVVTKDIPDNAIAYGNPCQVIKENKPWSI